MTSSQIYLVRNKEYGPVIRTLVRNSTRNILIAFFSADIRPGQDINNGVRELAHALAQARWRGVDVKVMVSELYIGAPSIAANIPFLDFLRARGVSCKYGHPINQRNAFHAKYCIFDSEVVLFGSHNISGSALHENEELSIATNNRRQIAEVKKRFQESWLQS